MELHLIATGCHANDAIWDHTVLTCNWTRTRSDHRTPPVWLCSTRFTYLGRMEDWVDLGDWLCIEMVYLHRDSNPSKY